MKSSVVSAWFLLVFWAAPGPALAADPVELKIVTNVVEGQAQAGVLVIAHEDLETVDLTIQSPPPAQTHALGPLTPGAEKFLPLAEKAGRHAFQGRLAISQYNGDSGEMPVSFELVVLPGLILKVPEERVSVEGKTLVLQASRPLRRVDVAILGEQGETLKEASVAPPTPMAQVDVAWPEVEGRVLRIDLVATDQNGTFAKLELSPWSIDVEQEEVNFHTASDEILPSEAPKLDRAYQIIQEKVARYGRLIHLNLYIVGYTDTVGRPDYNQGLSERRARSIARYFLKKGIPFPVYYQGFGEEILATPTPDDTDEIRNRRALYILGGDYRPRGPQIPRADWKPLH